MLLKCVILINLIDLIGGSAEHLKRPGRGPYLVHRVPDVQVSLLLPLPEVLGCGSALHVHLFVLREGERADFPDSAPSMVHGPAPSSGGWLRPLPSG